MQSNRLPWSSLCCALLAAATALPLHAQQRDFAEFMPADTAFYVGWSHITAPDAPELQFARQCMQTALAAAAEEEDEDTVALFSLIGDATLAMQNGSGGLGLFDVTFEEDHPDIQAALLIDAGAETTKLVDALRSFVTRVADQDQIGPHSVNGVSLQGVRIDDPPLLLLWGMHRGCLLVALGETAAGKVIDCMNGLAQPLTTNSEFTFDRRKVQAQITDTCFSLYVDVQRVLERGKAIAEQLAGPLPPLADQLIDQLGFRSMRSKYVHYHEVDGQPRMASFAHVVGPLQGLLTLWKQQPLEERDLAIIPQDAYWAEVGNLDLDALWHESLRIVEETAPDTLPMVQGSVAMTEGMLGLSITGQFLPALGDTWALFDAPDHGGMLLTGTVLVAEVRDADAIQAVLMRLVQIATPLAMQADLTIKQGECQHEGHTIHHVLIGGAPVPVAPAWCFVDDRWVFGLYPQAVAAAVRQVDPRTRGASLLDRDDVRAARALLPPRPIALGYVDSKYVARLFYPLLNALQTTLLSMCAERGAQVDLQMMPPVNQAVARTTNYIGVTAVDDDGVIYASVGDGSQLALGAVGGAALGTSILLPSLSRARELSKRAVSSANLKGIGMCCHIYANNHDERFPDSLDQMLEEDCLTDKMLRSPRDHAGGVSYVYIAGQNTAADDHRNVLAYERLIGDEGTNVLFADGHVQWLKRDAFKRALRATYERLGRENELPALLRD